MFGIIFAVLEFIGLVIVQIFKKIFAMALLALLATAAIITTVILVVYHQVT